MRGVYNRYQGNTGRVERRSDGYDPPPPGPSRTLPPEPPRQERPAPQAHPERRPPGEEGLTGALNGLLGRLSPGKMETEDLLWALFFYLLYRETGDREFLYMAGGMIVL